MALAKDIELLRTHNVPMPGTVLSSIKSRPRLTSKTYEEYRLFPNKMIRESLGASVTNLLQRPTNGRPAKPPTMDTVKDLLEKLMKDRSTLRHINHSISSSVQPGSKFAVRKMMSRYWDNGTSFTLNLNGAVMRQGLFVEKMVQIDWLHSPSAMKTMRRLVEKYKRFFTIMKQNPTKFVVPTLDVDLAWHTHQLSPQSYYAYTDKRCKTFIDHDDKVDEGRLSEAFEWTCKRYQALFTEVYSECTCWYCESKRSNLLPQALLYKSTLRTDQFLLDSYPRI